MQVTLDNQSKVRISFQPSQDRTKSILAKLASLPERKFYRGSGKIIFPLTISNVSFIQENLAEFEWPDDVRNLMDEIIAKHRSAEKPKDYHKKFRFKTKCMKHQIIGFNLSIHFERFGLFFDMGTGKTKLAIDLSEYYLRQKVIRYQFIIAPATVLETVWVEQFYEHSFLVNENDEFAPVLLTGTTKQRIQKLNSGGRIFIINYEGILVIEDELKRFFKKANGEIGLTLDESTRVKNPNAKTTKAIQRLQEFTRIRYVLTGTPSTQGYLDLYSQFRFLDENYLGYSTFTAFKTRYAVFGGFHNKEVKGWNYLDELITNVNRYSLTVRAEDCTDLPERLPPKRLVIELTKEQAKAYGEMEELLITFLQAEAEPDPENPDEPKIASVQNALAKLMKLRQITSGFIGDDDGEIHTLPSSKLKVLTELVDDYCISQGKKVIVQCVYRAEITRITETLNDKFYPGIAERLDGTVKQKDRAKLIKDFHHEDRLRVLVCQVQLASLGIDLTAASIAIRYSHTYSLQDTIQFEKRIHRIGQTVPVRYVDLLCRDTVDFSIAAALRDKKDIAQHLQQKGIQGFREMSQGRYNYGR